MSTIVTDTITGKSTATTITIGSTPVVSASANSMTIRGEGSAQTSIQQGLVKSWISANFATEAYLDSFNVSTLNDGGAGDTQVVLSTVMSTSAGNSLVVGGNHFVSGNPVPDKIATNQVDYRNFNDSGSLEDGAGNNHSLLLHGDLA